ncbi:MULTISPECIES: hypothetical protein [unclassified Roseovarius]|uniref:hypothetical protein n=1 Tax=unclassified Roseovarius TaxID=2614913 RepID=UPI00273F3327|nr:MULTISPECIES: hypothetical protein [unclassified Roseovarius]
MRILLSLIVALASVPHLVAAGERDFRLSAPETLIESGLLKHLLPRFSLKTQIRVELVDGAAEVTLAPDGDGVAVFTGAGATWHMTVAADHPGAARFADWLTSEVGHRTLTSFEVDGAQPFTLPEVAEAVATVETYDGDAAEGLKLSSLHCGRCHVVSADNRMNAIGSTPSFHVLRSLRDWDNRFRAFFALNPHPAFTQIEDVTEPFPINRPSPIAPVEMTLDDLDAIMAYVSRLEPANLGAPIKHQ